jgi:hypothetical protein
MIEMMRYEVFMLHFLFLVASGRFFFSCSQVNLIESVGLGLPIGHFKQVRPH